MRRTRLCAGLAVVVALGACGKRSQSPASEDAADDGGVEPVAQETREDAATGTSAPADTMADRAELPVFRFGPNLPLAHVQRGGGLVVDAGAPGFVKYLRFGMPELRWTLRQERDGVGVAVPERVASLEVPLTEAQAAAGVMYLGVHAPARRRLALKIDGRKAGAVELAPGWQIARVDVPEERLTAGESFVALETAGGEPPAVAWIQVGGGAPGSDAPVGPAAMRAPARYEPDTDTVVMAGDAGLIYHVHVPESARLVAAVEGEGCRVDVRAGAGDSSVEGALDSARAAVSLSLLAGRVARVELTAAGCDEVHVGQPRLTVAGAAHAAPSGPPPRYVVLWLMSGLRADRVRPFAPWARPEVPGLERLARTGTSFAPAWAQAAETRAARAALWTGRYPIRRSAQATGGKGEPGQAGKPRRRARAPSLGLEMREAGFQTVAVTAAMEPEPGFADGFDVWERVQDPTPGGDARAPAAGVDVLAQAVRHLDERYRDGPVFLLVETEDSRLPWIGHEPWLERYDPGAYEGAFARAAGLDDLAASPAGARAGGLADRMQCGHAPSDRDLGRLRAIYDTTVSYQDALLVQLVDRLAQWGILEQTLLVITSDHGQETWEDERCGHGASLRESLLGVPLLMHYPALVPAGRSVSRGAEAVDVLPTLLRILGLPAPEPVQGRSLVDATASPGYPQPMFAALGSIHAMRLGQWKIVVGRAGVPAIFDLQADPNEARNLAATHPAERRLLSDVLALHVFHRAAWNQRAWGSAANLTAAGWEALHD